MAIETHTYLVPLVEVEETYADGTVEVHTEYKTYLYIPEFLGTEETYHWMESQPADHPDWRFVEITIDETIHAYIQADSDIELIE